MTQDIRKYDDEGLLHCDDGPAVIKSYGDQCWYQHGKIHRDDGPAAIMTSGSRFWYQHGKNVTYIMEKWCSARGIDLNNLSEHDRQEVRIYMASL